MLNLKCAEFLLKCAADRERLAYTLQKRAPLVGGFHGQMMLVVARRHRKWADQLVERATKFEMRHKAEQAPVYSPAK